jgi:microcystin degradation protein MlrC
MKLPFLSSKQKPLRIAYGRLFHEACAASPVLTEVADFERMHLLEGDALAEATTLRGTELKSFMPHAELTGFRQAAALAGDVECVPLSSALAIPGGPLSMSAWQQLSGALLAKLEAEAARGLDGVYLALHGSMEVAGLGEAPEAALLRRVRAIVGPRVRIAVSYDLHANLSSGLVDPVDVLIAYRTNPHWDLFPTGFRAGSRLIRALRGELRPVSAWRKLPIAIGGGSTIDFVGPMRGVFRFMKKLEKRAGVVSASLFMVHPFTTAEHLGWAVHVTTNGDAALAERLADELADRAWAERDVPHPEFVRPEVAIEQARASLLRKVGPVTFIDCDDIVGAGAPGGNTRVLAALLQKGHGLLAYVPLHDPALVAQLWDAPLGSIHAVVFRGTPGYGAPEVPAEVVVAAQTTTDTGRTLRLDVGDVRVVITDAAPLPIHPSFWSAVGLQARDADVIIQKNFFHYRMFYATISFKHFGVVTAGATSFDAVKNADYVVPMVPKVRLSDWRPYDAALKQPKRPRSSEVRAGVASAAT